MLARASTFPGKLQKVIKHLGGLWDSQCTATPEISIRLEKAMKVWKMFVRVWHAPIVWMRNKIIFFRALVLSSLLSGLEAVVLGKTDIQRLERMQIHCLRVLLHGAARARSNEW
eukprot:4248463-Heterocapsa_arctica.AAC.1